jgi:hypothetical protein
MTSRFLGGSIFLAIGESIFVEQLVKDILSMAPGVDPNTIVAVGAQGVRKVVSVLELPSVLVAYNSAVTTVFVSFFPCLFEVCSG